MITLFPQVVGAFIGMMEWVTAIGTTLTATALIAMVALLWKMRDEVTSVVGQVALMNQKLEANNKESNLRFVMVDQKFAELTKQVEHQGVMLEQQRTWKWDEMNHST